MVRYAYLRDIPEKFQPTIEALMNAGIIQGDGSDPTGNGDVIDLSHDQVRTLVFAYRGGAFDARLRAAGLKPAGGMTTAPRLLCHGKPLNEAAGTFVSAASFYFALPDAKQHGQTPRKISPSGGAAAAVPYPPGRETPLFRFSRLLSIVHRHTFAGRPTLFARKRTLKC